GVGVAGTVGGGGRLEYTVVGDAVNLAQRLQAQAEGGQILASGATVAAAPSLRTEALGEVQVKGRREPVEIHRVLQPYVPTARSTPGRSHGEATHPGHRGRGLHLGSA